MKAHRILLLIPALMLAACVPVGLPAPTTGTVQPAETPAPTVIAVPPASSTAPAVAGDALANTHWRLVSFGPEGEQTPALPSAAVTLDFGADGHAGGRGGCNSYGGTYAVRGDKVTFGEIASTLMACADQATMDQEKRYLAMLRAGG